MEVCSDCDSRSPKWLAVNKGLVLCDDCATTHRNFGRHISVIKPLNTNTLSQHQLEMAKSLFNHGSNSIWEFSVPEANPKISKVKFHGKDINQTLKHEFLHAKHQKAAYVSRSSTSDLLCVENELGKQLLATVRTDNLEASLKLLIQGADPNYFHDEKGCTPLHVAAKRNKIHQAELLVLYGADPGAPDALGKSAIQVAREAGNIEIAERLTECEMEAINKLSLFFNGRKFDANVAENFPSPLNLPQKINPKLSKLPNNLFEELVMDVYDEIDRRELESLFQKSVETDFLTVPHLPSNPCLSVTRNQSRQKLARLSKNELLILVSHILKEAVRRQNSSPEENDYDSVASDEDESSASVDNSQNENMIVGLQSEIASLKKQVEALSTENDHLKTKLVESDSRQTSLSNISFDNTFHSSSSARHSSNNYLKSMDLPVNPTTNIDRYTEVRTRRSQRPTSLIDFNMKTPDRLGSTAQGGSSLTFDWPIICEKQEKIDRCAQDIAQSIKKLNKSIQEKGNEDTTVHINTIKFAVRDLALVLPQGFCEEALKELSESVMRLQLECKIVQDAFTSNIPLNMEERIRNFCTCAYNVAKTLKTIVKAFESKFS